MHENQRQIVYVSTPPGLVLEKKHDIAIVLSIFLGWLGIDRMYLGQAGIGLLKLITFGGFGLWWVIDIVMIASKNIQGINWVK